MAKIDPSVLLECTTGKAGTVVFYRHRGTLCMRPRVSTPNPRTPAQVAARERMSLAARIWKEMDPANVQAWNAYAATLPGDPTGNTAFIALATKWLQIHSPVILSDPERSRGGVEGPPHKPQPPNHVSLANPNSKLETPNSKLPMLPPTQPFIPPPAEVTAEAVEGGILFTIRTNPNQPPQTRINPNQPAQTQTNPNENCVELLLQPLPSPNRTPESHRYASKGFVTWTDSVTVLIDAPPGAYAPAYRFADPATGRSTPVVTLPVCHADVTKQINSN